MLLAIYLHARCRRAQSLNLPSGRSQSRSPGVEHRAMRLSSLALWPIAAVEPSAPIAPCGRSLMTAHSASPAAQSRHGLSSAQPISSRSMSGRLDRAWTVREPWELHPMALERHPSIDREPHPRPIVASPAMSAWIGREGRPRPASSLRVMSPSIAGEPRPRPASERRARSAQRRAHGRRRASAPMSPSIGRETRPRPFVASPAMSRTIGRDTRPRPFVASPAMSPSIGRETRPRPASSVRAMSPSISREGRPRPASEHLRQCRPRSAQRLTHDQSAELRAMSPWLGRDARV